MKQRTIKEWLNTTEEDCEDSIHATTQAFALVREFPMRVPARPSAGAPQQKKAHKADPRWCAMMRDRECRAAPWQNQPAFQTLHLATVYEAAVARPSLVIKMV